MNDQKIQIVEKLKQATNILVTVSANPSVDQLSAAIGLTLFLNHTGKHASAVFSGKVPSTMEFLQPEKTLEKTTDSLRDFIIALDKAKADKLRYKVEDQMVKIFITPYQTSITEKDLEFSHGDFNVEAVIALGVKEQGELDQAITAHGRILHDATVISIGTTEPGSLGSINWSDPAASSLCEMVTGLALSIKTEALDAQLSTALLTGIVAETERFSNEKTSSETMQLSAKLMAAGANQQLVASQLQQPEQPTKKPKPAESKPSDETEEVSAELPEPKDDTNDSPTSNKDSEEPRTKSSKSANDGSLTISHGAILPFGDDESYKPGDPEEPELEQIHIDEDGTIKNRDELELEHEKKVIEPPSDQSARLVLEPPTLGNKPISQPVALDPVASLPAPVTPVAAVLPTSDVPPLLDPAPVLPASPTPTEPAVIQPSVDPAPVDSLAALEATVDSAHAQDAPAAPEASVDAARNAVSQATEGVAPTVVEPVQALDVPPASIGFDPQIAAPPAVQDTILPGLETSIPDNLAAGLMPPEPSAPTSLIPPDPGLPADTTAAAVTDPTAPPPVPPPMMPPMNPPADGTPSSTAL